MDALKSLETLTACKKPSFISPNAFAMPAAATACQKQKQDEQQIAYHHTHPINHVFNHTFRISAARLSFVRTAVPALN